MPEGGSKQAAFAARLSRATGVPVSVSTLSNWETGRRTVPGPMLIEAAIASGSSVDALLASAGEPASDAWAETLSFPQRVSELERERDRQRPRVVELETELQQQGALLAAAMNALEAMKAAMERAGMHVEGTEIDLRTGTD